MTLIYTNLIAFVLGFAGGWLAFRKAGAKVESAAIQVEDALK